MSDLHALEDFLARFDHWAWWITAIVFFAVELAMPGIFFVWLGLAATATGFIVLLAPGLGWQTHVVLFALLGVVSAAVGRRYWKPGNIASADPTLNQRAVKYMGYVFTLAEPIVNGEGRVAVGDGTWLVAGPDLPAGSSVRVTGAEGTRLIVERA